MPFKPSIAASIPLLILLGLFVFLGAWQLQRAVEKDARLSEHAVAAEYLGLPPVDSATEFTRISVTGHFETLKHTLADNKVLAGRPGLHVYTPLVLQDGRAVLVNRGWLPLPADRRQLPEIPTPTGEVLLHGRIGPVPPPGRQLGVIDEMRKDLWPQLVTYPDIERVAGALGTPLYPMVLFLDESSAGGFEGRDWKPVFMTPSRHRAYAFQWFALAVTAVVAWLVLAVLRGRSS